MGGTFCTTSSTLTCSELAAWICHTMNGQCIPQLAGDLRRALRQLTTGTMPNQWAPCHFLCQDSDSREEKSQLVDFMLRRGILLPTDFDVRNDKVFYFKPLSPRPSYIHTYKVHPPNDKASSQASAWLVRVPAKQRTT